MTKKSLESAKKNLNTYDNIIFKNFAVSDKNGKLYMCEN